VYTYPPQDSEVDVANDPIAFAIERAALPLFGLVNFGALLIGLDSLYTKCFEIAKILFCSLYPRFHNWSSKAMDTPSIVDETNVSELKPLKRYRD
jgi:hypothetical protein